jgi:hypothetical protein
LAPAIADPEVVSGCMRAAAAVDRGGVLRVHVVGVWEVNLAVGARGGRSEGGLQVHAGSRSRSATKEVGEVR